uniref:OJ1485_B09.12 protein n=1 Tax=Oryza sativa subsp. japonica TaxID=39947 RepID=Q8RZI4_ORYSJ|nr:OJ1485_B09.12 [Oryza sativa Japonica Group]
MDLRRHDFNVISTRIHELLKFQLPFFGTVTGTTLGLKLKCQTVQVKKRINFYRPSDFQSHCFVNVCLKTQELTVKTRRTNRGMIQMSLHIEFRSARNSFKIKFVMRHGWNSRDVDIIMAYDVDRARCELATPAIFEHFSLLQKRDRLVVLGWIGLDSSLIGARDGGEWRRRRPQLMNSGLTDACPRANRPK